MNERKRTIVGFDPGTTSAIAVLDLDRNVLLLKSMRNAGFEDIVKEAGSAGKPVVVACDVSPAPEVVRRLAASFDAHLSVPEMDMEVGEKTGLAMAYAPADNHQRDSLAAALGSAGRLNGLIGKARNRGGGENWEEVFEKVLKGTMPNLSNRELIPRKPARRTTKNRLPIALKARLLERDGRRLREEMESQSGLVRAMKEENAKLSRKLFFEKQGRVRAVENARRFAAPNLTSKIRNLECLLYKKEACLNSILRKLKELEGQEVIILPSGREVMEGVVFVPVTKKKAANSGRGWFSRRPGTGATEGGRRGMR